MDTHYVAADESAAVKFEPSSSRDSCSGRERDDPWADRDDLYDPRMDPPACYDETGNPLSIQKDENGWPTDPRWFDEDGFPSEEWYDLQASLREEREAWIREQELVFVPQAIVGERPRLLPVLSCKEWLAHVEQRRRDDPEGVAREHREYELKVARRSLLQAGGWARPSDVSPDAGLRRLTPGQRAELETAATRLVDHGRSRGRWHRRNPYGFRLHPNVALRQTRAFALPRPSGTVCRRARTRTTRVARRRAHATRGSPSREADSEADLPRVARRRPRRFAVPASAGAAW